MFVGKKIVLILANDISTSQLAHTATLLGLALGKKIPQIVGRDMIVEGHIHKGITTENLPVLNGVDDSRMRTIYDGVKRQPNLLVNTVISATKRYSVTSKFVTAVKTLPKDETMFFGISIFGDTDLVNQYTMGLKLYGKQSKLSNFESDIRTVSTDDNSLPAIRIVLSNNNTGGRLANTAAILGITLSKLYPELISTNIEDAEGHGTLCFPLVQPVILNGQADHMTTLRTLREKLHEASDLAVVDVTSATGSTKSYHDYLAEAERTPVSLTKYWGLGICGNAVEVHKYTKDLGLYRTPTEEQEHKNKINPPLARGSSYTM